MKIVKGYTMMHEHLHIDLSKVKNNDDCNLNDMEATIKEFKELYTNGVRNILDVTNRGMGYDLAYIKKIEAASKIKIITSTGFYKDPFLPDYFDKMSTLELAGMLVKDLKEGASVIGEIGTSNNEWTQNEKKLFEAAVLASQVRSTVIYTHTTLGSLALEQAKFFLANKVNPDQVIIGHICLAKSFDLIVELIKLGFNLGFDTIGKNNYFPDDTTADFIKKLEDLDLLDKVVLSVDITRKSHLKVNGGIGYNYLFTDFIPLLLKKGVSQASIDKMLIANPTRILSYVE